MDKNSKCETALTWTPEGRRKVGRPKTTWRSTIENERRILGWNSWNDVAADRANWRRCTSALWATGPEEYRVSEVTVTKKYKNSELFLDPADYHTVTHSMARHYRESSHFLCNIGFYQHGRHAVHFNEYHHIQCAVTANYPYSSVDAVD